MSLPIGEIVVGDMREVLRAWSDNVVDAGVYDPPYELGIANMAWDRSGVAYDPLTWQQTIRVLKPGAYVTVFGGTRKHHRVWCAIEEAGLEIRDTLLWAHSQSITHASDMAKVLEREAEGEIDEDERERLIGRSTMLRPVVEPICLARKPIEGKLLDNYRRWGTGLLNIDDCRTPIMAGDRPSDAPEGGRYLAGSRGEGVIDGMRQGRLYVPHEDGRYPTNFILSHAPQCIEDGPCVLGCPVRELDEQSGIQKDGKAIRHRGSNFEPNGVWGRLGHKPPGTPDMTYGSSGGASRYYPVFRYCAKPSRAERDMGLDHRNPHVTVKPLSLIRWLVRLVTPPEGIVLDAFAGSGTTLAAAALERRRWLAVELRSDYATYAAARALAGAEQAGTVSAEQARASSRIRIQVGLFGEGDG